MFEKVNVKEINPHVFLLDESGESTGYLVVGKEKAVVIDTMNGEEDLQALVRTITQLPVMVINTHGHCDHVTGNAYFEEAWIHPDDLELAKTHMNFDGIVEFYKEKGLKILPFHFVQDGEIIDLGGCSLEVISLPGHTHGGILLLLKEDRILFTGDSINRHLWMQLEDSLPMEVFAENLDKIMYLKDEADIILHGHTQSADAISLLVDLRTGVQEILDGKVQEDKPYHWFGGEDKQHVYCNGKVICYKESNVFLK